MNWLLISVFVILAGMTAIGFWKGFIRIAISMVSTLALMMLVSWINPYLTEFLKEHTEIHEDLSEKCAKSMQRTMEEKIQENLDQKIENTLAETEGQMLGIPLPQMWVRQLQEVGGAAVNQVLEESDIYRQVGEYIADWMVRGISFLASMALAGIVLKFIFSMLNVLSKLPVVHGANRILGGMAGLLMGFILVCILMLVIAMVCTSQFGQNMLRYIKESEILSILYVNNPLMYLL